MRDLLLEELVSFLRALDAARDSGWSHEEPEWIRLMAWKLDLIERLRIHDQDQELDGRRG